VPSVTVLYFAALRDLAGVGEEQLDVDTDRELSVSTLLLELQQRQTRLQGRLEAVRVAVNEEFSELGTRLHGGDVVALIPPVSGG
jgi:molybdopterin synthase sulfur carrier subunit